MRTSSATQTGSSTTQLELDYPVPSGSLGSRSNSTLADSATSAEEGNPAASPVQLPNFRNYDKSLYAITSRRAGRLNAANISTEEHELLLRERKSLLDKKFAGQLTKKEAYKLEYVRWSLDRIEDAKYGEAFEALEGAVSKYEQFLDDIRNLQTQLARHQRKHK
jgi:hypothetical protein